MAKRTTSSSKSKSGKKSTKGKKKTTASKSKSKPKAKSKSTTAKKKTTSKKKTSTKRTSGSKSVSKKQSARKSSGRKQKTETPAPAGLDPALEMGLVETPEEKLPPVKFNKRDLNAITKALESIYQRLTQDVGALTQNNLSHSGRDMSGDLSGYGFHMADVATDNFAREMELNIATGETDRLRMIEEAFDRLEEGTFGRCEACKEPIGVPRLKVIPYARLCIRCAEEAERR